MPTGTIISAPIPRASMRDRGHVTPKGRLRGLNTHVTCDKQPIN
jgi:hypothetical protein